MERVDAALQSRPPGGGTDGAAEVREPRERILDAARDLVAAGGWRDAQIALIAHRAGVATGSVYRHFDSKADLYAQVLARVSQREVEVVAAVIDSEGSAAQRLVDSLYLFSLRAMRGRTLAYALIAEPCDAGIDVARLRYRAELAGEIARLLRDGVERGELIDVDVDLAASCVTGAVMEALVGPLAPETGPDQASAREVAQAIAGLAARMVTDRPAPELRLVSAGLR